MGRTGGCDGRASRCRCTRPSTSTSSPSRSRACTRTCRSCATPTAGPTSRRRSAAWSSAASSPRPSRGCAPDQIPYPFEFQLLDEDWEHFSVLMDERAARGSRRSPRPGSASSTTAPRASPPTTSSCSGEAPEVRGFFVGAGLQLGRHRLRRRRRPGAGRVDRRGRADHRPDRRRHPPVRAASTATTGWLRDRVARGARAALRGAVAQPRAARPRGRSAARRCTTCSPRDGAGFGSRMGWERANFFAPAGRATRRSSTPGASRAGCRGRPPSRRAPATAVAVFDQTSFSKYARRRARTPRRRCSGCAPPTSPSPVGTRRLHRRCSTRAAPTSPT